MANSEPWLTLCRDYQAALTIFTDADNEKYIVLADDERAGFVVIVMKGAFTGYIKSVAVAPAFRNRGLGRRVIEFANG
jgi:ribosomal protein S18 acetylase RimI-like enzyme